MITVTCNKVAEDLWNEFILKNTDATYAHLYGWKKVIHKTYGHDAFYFEAWRDNILIGVLPTIYIKSLLFGKQLVSMPFLDTGAPLAANEECFKSLAEAVISKANELKADVSLRSITPQSIELPCAKEKVTMYMPLKQSAEDMLLTFTPERRNRIKKAIKNGLHVTFHGNEALDEFYSVFAENMRDLGSPVHSKKLFQEVLNEFPNQSGLVVARDKEGIAMGAGLYFTFKNILALPWVSSRREYFKLNPNIILYWELLKWGCERQMLTFDFGRSSVGSGTYEFKRQWGAEPVQLYWYSYLCNKGKSLDAIDTNKNSNKTMMNVWKRMPLGITNKLGPLLRKSISL